MVGLGTFRIFKKSKDALQLVNVKKRETKLEMEETEDTKHQE